MASHVASRVSDPYGIFKVLAQTPINTEELVSSIDSYSKNSKPVVFLPVYERILQILTRKLLQSEPVPKEWNEHCKLNNVVIEKMDDYNPHINRLLYKDVFKRVVKQKQALINAEAYVVHLNPQLEPLKITHKIKLETLEKFREFNPNTDKEIKEENNNYNNEMQQMKAEYEKMLNDLRKTLT